MAFEPITSCFSVERDFIIIMQITIFGLPKYIKYILLYLNRNTMFKTSKKNFCELSTQLSFVSFVDFTQLICWRNAGVSPTELQYYTTLRGRVWQLLFLPHGYNIILPSLYMKSNNSFLVKLTGDW